MDAQHRRQWVWMPCTFLSRLWVVVFDQGSQHRQGHDRLYLGENFLRLVYFLAVVSS